MLAGDALDSPVLKTPVVYPLIESGTLKGGIDNGSGIFADMADFLPAGLLVV
jgi:hypothetical protein